MRLLLLSCVSLLVVGGCARPPRYNVYVTGYTGGAPTAIPTDASVAVVENPNARNPLLEQEIVAKTRRALANQGFRTADARDANLVVMLQYGSDSRLEQGEQLRIDPGQRSTITDSTGKVVGTVTGDLTVSVQPTLETRDIRWLTMTAVDGPPYRESRPVKPVWIGEARSSGANLPLRELIDFLLVPTASAFGRNLPQRRTVLRADDPKVQALRAP